MSDRKIFFQGVGLVTSLGNSIEKNLEAIISMEINNKPTNNVEFSHLNKSYRIPYRTIHSPDVSVGVDRIYHIIDHVIEQALADSDISGKDSSRFGLFVGSTSFDIYSGEQSIKRSDLSDEQISAQIPPFTRLTSHIARKYNIAGPVYSINTACTSSANALMYAAEFIRRGDIDEALVLGLEFFNEMTAQGFWGLDLISKTTMRPFRDDRDGLILGEGCSAMVLSKQPAEHKFGYVSGANLGDNFSITACNTDGTTVARVIHQALDQADLAPADISLVKAHGTASLSNDEAEAAGLQQVFSSVPPVVVLKPILGHTLGACGTNELILFYQALLHGCLPVMNDADPASDSFGLQFLRKSDSVSEGYFLLNYFGFGGNNTALIVSNV
jgi:3-oxoacyl-[acyl-carrier-protein] synthase-1